MTINEAQQIVSEVGKLMSNPPEGDSRLVHPITVLPCSPAKVKFAFFLTTEHLIKEEALSSQQAEALISIYASINTAFREQADEINNEYRKILKEINRGKTESLEGFKLKYNLESALSPSSLSLQSQIEFHNYIADCQNNYQA